MDHAECVAAWFRGDWEFFKILVSAIVGGALSFGAQAWMEFRRREAQRKTAAMAVAAALWRWVVALGASIVQNDKIIFTESQEDFAVLPNSMLDQIHAQISLLDAKTAQVVFFLEVHVPHPAPKTGEWAEIHENKVTVGVRKIETAFALRDVAAEIFEYLACEVDWTPDADPQKDELDSIRKKYLRSAP